MLLDLLGAVGPKTLTAFERKNQAAEVTHLHLLYNDIFAQRAGLAETCNALVTRKQGQAFVCFAPDHLSESRSLGCPPGQVIQALATGVYHEVLAKEGLKPDQVHYAAYMPSMHIRMHNMTTPPTMRWAHLVYGPKGHPHAYDVSSAPAPMATRLFEKLAEHKIPAAVQALPDMRIARMVDLRGYTPPLPHQRFS